jgi:hypothetical protein
MKYKWLKLILESRLQLPSMCNCPARLVLLGLEAHSRIYSLCLLPTKPKRSLLLCGNTMEMVPVLVAVAHFPHTTLFNSQLRGLVFSFGKKDIDEFE